MTTEQYKLMNSQIKALTEGESHWVPNMANISSVLWNTLPDINWVGFYTIENDSDGPYLLLGPFAGKPACIRLRLGKGVCSAAIRDDSPIIVPDVHQFPGHIACDSASKSEMVIPVHVNGKAVAVLDIDSPVYNRFSSTDLDELSEVVRSLEHAISK